MAANQMRERYLQYSKQLEEELNEEQRLREEIQNVWDTCEKTQHEICTLKFENAKLDKLIGLELTDLQRKKIQVDNHFDTLLTDFRKTVDEMEGVLDASAEEKKAFDAMTLHIFRVIKNIPNIYSEHIVSGKIAKADNDMVMTSNKIEELRTNIEAINRRYTDETHQCHERDKRLEETIQHLKTTIIKMKFSSKM